MKKRFLIVLLCFSALLSVLGANTVWAENRKTEQSSVTKAKNIIQGIVTYHQKDGKIQSWIDGALAKTAGSGAEFYILGLSQYGTHDGSAYEKNLLEYLSRHPVSSASSRLKYALCLSAVGSTDGYISKTVNDSIGKQGIMSYVFGLHLLNNGYASQTETTESVINAILSLQFSDGGWAIMGTYSDVDVTAMTVQALAPHYATDSKVKNAIEQALTLLSQRQNADGTYSSYGESNPESTAQVLLALSSLGIDCIKDQRFWKNGNSLFNGIELFRLRDGSFRHKAGEVAGETATVQVFDAMVAYVRMTEQKPPFYVLDHIKKDLTENSPTATDTATAKPETPQPETPQHSPKPTAATKLNYKLWVIPTLVVAGGIACLILFLCKKKHKKNFIAVFLVVALAVGIVLVTDFRSADDYYNGQPVVKENAVGEVTLTIRCDTVVGKSEADDIPKDGIILKTTRFAIAEGDTVYDILMEAARTYKIQVENDGTEQAGYITGIQYLYAFDYGELSGWVYHVNGKESSVSCSSYKLSDGDEIQWLYTCALGKDVA